MRIIIADDHAVVRTGFSMILNYQTDMEVVATAADGVEALEKVQQYRPDVLLLDLSMPPGESGLVATGKIKEQYPETKILILTMYDDDEYLLHVLRNGANGYILKNSPDEDLISAIRKVYAGGTYIDPKVADVLVDEIKNPQSDLDTKDPFKILTKRELEVLPLVAKGYGNKEISEILYISVKTVEAHKTKIMDKLELSNRPELVEYAMKKKLIDF